MSVEIWVAIIGVVAALMAGVIPRLVANASGGPFQTRRSKRLLDQTKALEDDRPGPDTKAVAWQAAYFQHKESLLKEFARLRAPYSPAVVGLLGGVVYAVIGLGYLNKQDQITEQIAKQDQITGQIFMWLAGVFVVFVIWGVLKISAERRAMVQRGLGSEAFPLLSAHRKNGVEADAQRLAEKDEKAVENEKKRQADVEARQGKGWRFLRFAGTAFGLFPRLR